MGFPPPGGLATEAWAPREDPARCTAPGGGSAALPHKLPSAPRPAARVGPDLHHPIANAPPPKPQASPAAAPSVLLMGGGGVTAPDPPVPFVRPRQPECWDIPLRKNPGPCGTVSPGSPHRARLGYITALRDMLTAFPLLQTPGVASGRTFTSAHSLAPPVALRCLGFYALALAPLPVLRVTALSYAAPPALPQLSFWVAFLSVALGICSTVS